MTPILISLTYSVIKNILAWSTRVQSTSGGRRLLGVKKDKSDAEKLKTELAQSALRFQVPRSLSPRLLGLADSIM
jgi:hypothetical protein